MTAQASPALVRAVLCVAALAAGSSAALAQVAVPGTIQAEDFDQGPSGSAYLDTTPGNSGQQYRQTDVDIEATTDQGAGHNVAWMFAGEWLRYTIDVARAGTYDIEVRVASNGSGGTFHIEVDGVDKTGRLTIPSTGHWQTWTNVRRTGVSLAAGRQVWRLVMDTNGPTTAVGNINYIRVTGPTNAASSTPYSGTPVALPGTLQAEDFDNGGEGVAYHDLSLANDGGQHRPTGVDLEWTADSGGSHNVGYAFAGEWLAYTVNVLSAGTYDVEVRVASLGAGGTFHIEVNGVDRTGAFTVPSTGSWQTWTTLRRTGLTLAAGQQVWRLVMDTNGATTAVGNFNFIRVAPSAGGGPTPFSGTPIALPGTLQLEAFDNGGEGVAYRDLSPGNSGGQYRATAVDIEAVTGAPGDYNIGWAFAGEWLAYTVDVSAAGTYDIEARIASAGAGGTFHLEVNGVDRTGPFTVPDTGGWQNWLTIRKTGLTLAAGRQVWRLVMDTNGASTAVGNLNHLRLVSAGSNQPPGASIASPSSGAIYTAPASITINASASDTNGTVSRVDFYAGSQLLGTDSSSPYSFTWTDVAAGTYSLSVTAFDNDGASSSSASIPVTVNSTPGSASTTIVFTPSADHDTAVTSYSVAIYHAADPTTATPAAARSLGKPVPSNNEISVVISDIVNLLPAGSYYVVITASGLGGSASSSPTPPFTK